MERLILVMEKSNLLRVRTDNLKEIFLGVFYSFPEDKENFE